MLECGFAPAGLMAPVFKQEDKRAVVHNEQSSTLEDTSVYTELQYDCSIYHRWSLHEKSLVHNSTDSQPKGKLSEMDT